jgi:OFA family oxalate/formate antiporter-like MFS transporter
VFSLAVLAFTAGVLAAPGLARRLGNLRLLGMALALGAAMASAAAVAPGFAVFLAVYSLGFGASAGVVYIAAVDIAARGQQPEWRVPLAVAAFGLGGAIFGAVLAARVAAGAGLGGLAWVALPLAAVSVPVLVLARGPDDRPLPPQAGRPATWPVRLWVVFAPGSLGGLVALGLAQPILTDRGAGPGLGGTVVVAVALGNVAGRLGAGVLARGLHPARIVAAAQAAGGLALLSLLAPAGPGVALGLITLVALAYGVTAAAVPLLTRAEVGPQHFAATFALVFTGWGTAGLVGPWLAGALRDATGSWASGLALAALGSAVSLVLVLTAPPPKG